MARNEEHTIAEVVRGAAPYADEVVVMDGGSADRTADHAIEAGARVIQDPGVGKGAAVRLAIDRVDADVLVLMDADGSHDPHDIPKLALPIVEGRLDLVVGSRFMGGSEELSISFAQLIRTIGNILMNITINWRWRVQLSDTLNGYRAVRRSAVRKVGLRESRHTVEQEMVMKMLRHGYRVGNVPTHEFARTHGTSHINVAREWPLFAWCVARNVVYRGPASARRPDDERA